MAVGEQAANTTVGFMPTVCASRLLLFNSWISSFTDVLRGGGYDEGDR